MKRGSSSSELRRVAFVVVVLGVAFSIARPVFLEFLQILSMYGVVAWLVAYLIWATSRRRRRPPVAEPTPGARVVSTLEEVQWVFVRRTPGWVRAAIAGSWLWLLVANPCNITMIMFWGPVSLLAAMASWVAWGIVHLLWFTHQDRAQRVVLTPHRVEVRNPLGRHSVAIDAVVGVLWSPRPNRVDVVLVTSSGDELRLCADRRDEAEMAELAITIGAMAGRRESTAGPGSDLARLVDAARIRPAPAAPVRRMPRRVLE